MNHLQIKKNSLGIVLIALSSFLSCMACSLGESLQNESIEVYFPQIPSEIRSKLTFEAWELRYINAERKITQKTFPISQKKIVLKLQKNTLTPILLYPLLKHEISIHTNNVQKEFFLSEPFFKPAGALYPHGTQKNRKKIVQTDWQAGFTAYFLFELINKSQSSSEVTIEALSRINWYKFLDTTKKTPNPWQLEKSKLYDAIKNGKIGSTAFKKNSTVKTLITLSPQDAWLHSSYVPSSFFFAQKTENQDLNAVFEVYLENSLEKIISKKNIYGITRKNGGKRLVITSIPY